MATPVQAKAIHVESKGKAVIRRDPLPRLRDEYLLVKTTAVGLNPADWKQLILGTEPGAKLGCDYVGVVEEVGSGVPKAFKKGDRVAGFAHGSNGSQHEDGAFGEYIVVKAGLAFIVPDRLSDQEAATLGLGIATVGQGLYQSLKLPLPTQPLKESEPLLIYGGGTPTGLLGIQFAKQSGFTVVATASARNFDLIRSMGADAVFEYQDADNCVADIRQFTGGRLRLVWDCVGLPETAAICARALSSDEDSQYSTLLPLNPDLVTSVNPKVQPAFTIGYTAFGEQFQKWGRINEAKPEDYEFAKMFYEMARSLLEQGKVQPVRQLVNQGGHGLEGVLKGLEELGAGKVGAAKLVYTL